MTSLPDYAPDPVDVGRAIAAIEHDIGHADAIALGVGVPDTEMPPAVTTYHLTTALIALRAIQEEL